MQEIRINPLELPPEEQKKSRKQADLVFKINHTMPFTEEYDYLVKELFKGKKNNFIDFSLLGEKFLYHVALSSFYDRHRLIIREVPTPASCYCKNGSIKAPFDFYSNTLNP